jgi:gas vesicle structural protein
MTVATQRRSDGYVERGGGGGGSSLADVVELILDRGLVIDVFVRVSLVGIELITIDARIVVASVDTFLRFAEATNRLDLYGKGKGGKDLPELMEGVTESGTKGKTSGVLEAAADKVGDMIGGGRDERGEPRERAEREEAPRRRPARQRPREREE